MPDALAFPATSLDDPSLFKPSMAVFGSSAQPWDYVDPALSTFETMPA